ncbi:MAG: phospholipase D-like domain-containing protein, partial [Flavobacterium sp.]|nr:phospholipase D-like domain-containing protein [Flavobacterium sp.]
MLEYIKQILRFIQKFIFSKLDNSYVAYIGSSNTTNWGLEKNVEMNFQVNDQDECRKLIKWFNELY